MSRRLWLSSRLDQEWASESMRQWFVDAGQFLRDMRCLDVAKSRDLAEPVMAVLGLISCSTCKGRGTCLVFCNECATYLCGVHFQAHAADHLPRFLDGKVSAQGEFAVCVLFMANSVRVFVWSGSALSGEMLRAWANSHVHTMDIARSLARLKMDIDTLCVSSLSTVLSRPVVLEKKQLDIRTLIMSVTSLLCGSEGQQVALEDAMRVASCITAMEPLGVATLAAKFALAPSTSPEVRLALLEELQTCYRASLSVNGLMELYIVTRLRLVSALLKKADLPAEYISDTELEARVEQLVASLDYKSAKWFGLPDATAQCLFAAFMAALLGDLESAREAYEIVFAADAIPDKHELAVVLRSELLFLRSVTESIELPSASWPFERFERLHALYPLLPTFSERNLALVAEHKRTLDNAFAAVDEYKDFLSDENMKPWMEQVYRMVPSLAKVGGGDVFKQLMNMPFFRQFFSDMLKRFVLGEKPKTS
jgi:hypothetical protein